jgi:Tfp pilus assembly protein FimT
MTNPYESPCTPPEPIQRPRRRLKITMVDLLVLVAIATILVALYLPAVESGPHHRRNRQPAEEVQPE